MLTPRPSARWLLPISAVAACLRLVRLTRHDVINDEVFYGFRSIGLVDTLNAPTQPTPFEWFDPVPWWAHLSFHDHPPLGFWILHGFFRLFGSNLVGLRLASALAGTASVVLTYLVAKRLLREERAALLAAAILAVNSCHVWFSRIAMQESLVVFFMLLATWLFLKTLDDPRYFYATVAATGVALLTKYTAVVLLPVFCLYAWWTQRELLTWRRLAGAAALLALVLAPVLLYNAMLYRTRHHFDFQLSYLLGQHVAEWQLRPGRQVGALPQRMRDFLPQFVAAFGPLFAVLTASALGLGLWLRRQVDLRFVGLQLALLVALLLAIGPTLWFLALLAPMLAVLAAGTLAKAAETRRFVAAAVAMLLLGELCYGINSSFAVEPWGREGWTYSVLHRDAREWGYNQLEAYLQEKTRGRYPARGFPLSFGFARDLNRRAVARARAAGQAPARILFVTDSSISHLASLWYFSRRQLYQGWPMIDDRLYLEATQKDPRLFARQGFEEIVFVRAVDTLLEPGADGRAGAKLEAMFGAAGVEPRWVARASGQTAFRVYEARARANPPG